MARLFFVLLLRILDATEPRNWESEIKKEKILTMR